MRRLNLPFPLSPQDAWLNSPWRAEPLYELAKWHDQQLPKCNNNTECENKHHMGAFLNAKMVRRCVPVYSNTKFDLWKRNSLAAAAPNACASTYFVSMHKMTRWCLAGSS